MSDDICQECGATIEHATVNMPGPFGILECRQALCMPCAFAQYTKQMTTCPRPYKKPRTRYMADGRLSPDFIQRFNEQKAHFNQEV